MTLRLDMAALSDDLLRDVVGPLGFTPHLVALRTVSREGANSDAGVVGTEAPLDVPLDPQPYVELKSVFRNTSSGVVVLGDALVTGISIVRYTSDQLRSAEAFVIDGVEYHLVDGGIIEQDLELQAILKRRQA